MAELPSAESAIKSGLPGKEGKEEKQNVTRLGNRRFDLDFGEEMLDDPRVMHGEASGDIITTAAQRRHEVSQSAVTIRLGRGYVRLYEIAEHLAHFLAVTEPSSTAPKLGPMF